MNNDGINEREREAGIIVFACMVIGLICTGVLVYVN